MILRGVWRLRGKTSKMEFYLNWKKVSQHFIQPALTSDSAFYHFSHTRSAAMWLSVFSEYMLYGKRLQADDLFLKGHNLIFTPHYDGEDLLHVSGFFFFNPFFSTFYIFDVTHSPSEVKATWECAQSTWRQTHNGFTEITLPHCFHLGSR